MLGYKFFEEVGAKISEAIATSPAKDIEKNIRAILSATLSRLNFVTREEFNLQQESIINTREQIDQLRAQLNQLDHDFKKGSPPKKPKKI